MVVGEEDIALKMLGRGAGVMAEAREAEVGAQRIEQRERLRRGGVLSEQAVGEFVADVGEFGGRKMAREFERGHPAHVRLVARVEHIRSEEHTSELQSLMRNSHAVFSVETKNQINITHK